MSEDRVLERDPSNIEQEESLEDIRLEAMLSDPKRREEILRRIREKEECRQHLTPSGMSVGGWSPYPPAPYWPGPFPPFPNAGAVYPFPAWGGGRGQEGRWVGGCSEESTSSTLTEAEREPEAGSSRKRAREEDESENEDMVDLLGDEEALEFVEFDPKVDPTNSWKTPQSMKKFLDKHFNKALAEEEKEAILKDFPKPDAKALVTPKMDDQAKDQLKKKGRSPHFGMEKSLYRIQEQLLGVAGPLTCLWGDLLDKGTNGGPEEILLLVQRALVLLGNASHSITTERRKITWARINPRLKDLATEEYKERDTNLFGPSFLEKASKRIEVEKTLSKVSNEGKPSYGSQQSKRPRYGDSSRFLSKGASARGGSSRYRHFQPPAGNQYSQFKSRRYRKEGAPNLPRKQPQEKNQ